MAKKKSAKDWRPSIQHVLRAARVEHGVTQRQLSMLLDKPANVVNLIETGNRSCSLSEFLQICEVIGADPIDIIGRMLRWHKSSPNASAQLGAGGLP